MIGKEDKVLPGSGVQIRHKGKIDLDSLYSDVKGWFDSRRYDFTEKEQTTKDKPAGKEIIIKWEGEREFDDYAKFVINVDFFMEDVNKIKGSYEGSVKATFFAKIVLDYKHKFKTSRFNQILFNIYNNFVIKRKIENVYEDKLNAETKELYNLVKEKLELMKE